MAEIYQLPDNSGNAGMGNIPFSIPIGGFGGNGMFGNGTGFNSIADLFGLAIIASMFGWGNNGFGGFGGFGGGGAAGFLSNQLNNDSGRELIMQAVTNQGEASRTAVQTLSTMLGQDFNLVNSAVANVQNSLNQIANNQGISTLQVINAIQSGNASLASQLCQCCCDNRQAILEQTNSLQNGIAGVQQSIAAAKAAQQLSDCQQTYALTDTNNRNTAAIISKLDAIQTQSLQDKLDAARAENTRLAGEISQAQQNQYIAGVIGQSMAPVNAQLAALNKEVDDIKCKLPNTVNVEYPNLVAVNASPYVSGGFYQNGYYGGVFGNGFGNNIVF